MTACAESSHEKTGHSVNVCFYELRFEVATESDLEHMLEVKARIENEYYRGDMLVRPLMNRSMVYFADECSKQRDYLDTRDIEFLRESSGTEYNKQLGIEAEETL